MNDSAQPQDKKPKVTMHYQSVVTCERPSDIETKITQHEFEMVCAGDTNKEETKRDNARNLFFAALIGLAGMASTDWSTSFRMRPWLFYVFLVIFIGAVAWFGNEWHTFAGAAKQKLGDSLHSKMRADIRERFKVAAAVAASMQSEVKTTTANENPPAP